MSGSTTTSRGAIAAGAVVVLAVILAALVVAGGGVAGAAQGDTERVSVASNGAEGNTLSIDPAVSGNGRYVVFRSPASNLVEGDNNGNSDVFVHDRDTGETTRVSVDSEGEEVSNGSFTPDISADGRYIVFQSADPDLVEDDANTFADVFVHDRDTGVTSRVSVDSNGVEANSDSDDPAVSADGRFVVFRSFASNLVAGDTNGAYDMFVHDRDTGETTRVSVDSNGVEANSASNQPVLSADGRFVVFRSIASNLVAGDTNGTPDVLVHDRDTGETTRVSVDSGGVEGNADSSSPVVSADGRYVVFRSFASNLVEGDNNGNSDVFVHDRDTGETTRVSVDSNGVESTESSGPPAVSADGRFVAFHSIEPNLVEGDTNVETDVFVHDRDTGVTTRVSVDSGGVEGNAGSSLPVISADGRFVAFESRASNLVAGDTNLSRDVFVHQFLADPPPPTTTTTTPTTQPEPPPVDWFVDDDGHTFEGDINAIADAGVTRGCNPPVNDMFCPDRNLIRAETATFLARVLDLPPSVNDWFTDDEGNTHEDNINRLAEAGITIGCNPPTNDMFCPDRDLTRAETASLLSRAGDLASTATDWFTDDEGNTHEDQINRLAEAGITRGCNPPTNDLFCPDDPVTRGQIAAFINRGFLD